MPLLPLAEGAAIVTKLVHALCTRFIAARPTLFGGGVTGVKKPKTSRGSKGKKYRKTGNQMDVERRQSDHGGQGGASGGGGLSQSGGS